MEIVYGYSKDFALSIWQISLEMAPYLLFGFLVAGILSILISPSFVERHLGGRGLWPVIKASLFGVPLPLCSCSVIPVTASLRKHGASNGSAISFLLSTPQTGVDSIMVTYSLLGPIFAIFRPVAAFITGIIGGGIVNITEGSKGEDRDVPECTDECCAPKNASASKWVRIFDHGFVTLPRDITKPLIIGLIIAGLIDALIPDNFFQNSIGGGIMPMFLMMLVGIPMYVCATASVPIALAMMVKGVSAGAALVFLMTGPATNAASIVTIWKLFGRRTAMTYLAVVAVLSIAFGLLLDSIYAFSGSDVKHVSHEMLPAWVNMVSLAVLAVVLAIPFLRRKHRHSEGDTCECCKDERVVMKIGGMHCDQCAETIRENLAEIKGVAKAEVSKDDATAVVYGKGIDRSALTESVVKLGFKVESLE